MSSFWRTSWMTSEPGSSSRRTFGTALLHRDMAEPSGSGPCHPAGWIILDSPHGHNNSWGVGEDKERWSVSDAEQQLVWECKHCSSNTLLFSQSEALDHQMSLFLPFTGIYLSHSHRCLYSISGGHGYCFMWASWWTHHSSDKSLGRCAHCSKRANLKCSLSNIHQHITCPTRVERMLDHCYTSFKDSYTGSSTIWKIWPCHHFPMPKYKQRLKQEAQFQQEVTHWMDQLVAILWNALYDADWDMFRRSSHNRLYSPEKPSEHFPTRSHGWIKTSATLWDLAPRPITQGSLLGT